MADEIEGIADVIEHLVGSSWMCLRHVTSTLVKRIVSLSILKTNEHSLLWVTVR